jgi:hypothetical protein
MMTQLSFVYNNLQLIDIPYCSVIALTKIQKAHGNHGPESNR